MSQQIREDRERNINVWLPIQDYRQLKALAKKLGVTVSHLIRNEVTKLLDYHLPKHRRTRRTVRK